MRFAPRNLMLTRLLAVVALGASLFANGCAKGTYLEVRVVGGAVLGDVFNLRTALTLLPTGGGKLLHSTDVIHNDDPTKPIKFPATMAFSLDDEAGALQIDVTALGTADLPLGSGSASTSVMHGSTWTVPVNLNAL